MASKRKFQNVSGEDFVLKKEAKVVKRPRSIFSVFQNESGEDFLKKEAKVIKRSFFSVWNGDGIPRARSPKLENYSRKRYVLIL